MFSDTEIKSYFNRLNRRDFMDIHQASSGLDRALPIGYEQTISQPSLVLLMTLYLKLSSNSKVLEIGTGSGFQTALLSQFSQTVFTVERIEALYLRAKDRLNTLGYTNIHFHYGDGNSGWPEHAPYDRIMVTAASPEIPEALVEQLSPGGRMVIPIGSGHQELTLIEKDNRGRVTESFIEDVMFVMFKKGIE